MRHCEVELIFPGAVITSITVCTLCIEFGKLSSTCLLSFIHLQLPGLIHISDKGRVWWGKFAMINLGFILSFAALLLLAMFEDELNKVLSS